MKLKKNYTASRETKGAISLGTDSFFIVVFSFILDMGICYVLRGKFLMPSNRILGSQAETQRWALEIKPKGYRCGVSLPKQEIEAAP